MENMHLITGLGNFGGVQGMQSMIRQIRSVVSTHELSSLRSGFAKKFGEYNEATNLWALPSYLSSVMTATPFFGKAIVSQAT